SCNVFMWIPLTNDITDIEYKIHFVIFGLNNFVFNGRFGSLAVIKQRCFKISNLVCPKIHYRMSAFGQKRSFASIK
ncbi:MAG: hypothetical protein O6852_04175, partial [Gammaproteobacteria bacterium]|nr:hypothetical protein [Gammaproteobacteria bacterium]